MSRAHPLRVADYLQHIVEAIAQIQSYTAGMDLDEFMADRKTSDAVILNWVLQQLLPIAGRHITPQRLGCMRTRAAGWTKVTSH